jgi:ribosomal protein S3AE
MFHQHQQQNQSRTPVNKPTAIARCDPVSPLTKVKTVKKNIKNIIKERASKLTYPQFLKAELAERVYRRGSFRVSFISSTV